MPRRAYIADLQRLTNASGIEGITNVRAGDDDGEFKFSIIPELGSKTYEISALIPDLSEYPSSHMYHIFVSDDNAPAHVAQTLDQLPNTDGLGLSDLLEVVWKAFSKDDDGDAHMLDSQYEDEGLSQEDFSDDEEEKMFGVRSIRKMPSIIFSNTASAVNREQRARIRSDLKLAKDAGFRIGHQGPLMDGQSSYVSVAIRITKLGISEEAMQAWQLRPTDYLILVIHYPDGYQTIDSLKGLDPSGVRNSIAFRIGVSRYYKPTLQEAIAAFTKLSNDDENRQRKEEVAQSKVENKHKEPQGFHECFISRPLNDLLNERLATILKYRYIGVHWTGAEKFYNDYQGKTFTMTGKEYMDPKYTNVEERNPDLPSIITADHLQDSDIHAQHSLPLMAFQFLLRHFVRCTEFCLVCHCKLEHDLEALKPYVCDNPLCLYQYMSLGFGPSIEHEIISQPYVVDLLISFCYHSALAGKLTTFPSGLSLNVPPPHVSSEAPGSTPIVYRQVPTPSVTPAPDAKPHKAKFYRKSCEIIFDNGAKNPLRVGDWICFYSSNSSGVWEHCRVVETHLFPTIKLSHSVSQPLNSSSTHAAQLLANTTNNARLAASGAANLAEEFKFHIYNTNFDTLNEQQKRCAIITQLDLLPSVKELKEYLVGNRTATLANWTEKISPTASGILRWIIASNRACIVQIDNPDSQNEISDRLQGMPGWMQFRFAMGAPDKERRFISSVQQTSDRLKLAYPTLFAWHGSPLQNWHSIIREGLHFKEVSHGRAYGNGCYHSLNQHTSQGYSGTYYSYTRQGLGYSTTWPSSALKVTSAMALNEIVNAPQEFVSCTPHLVVKELDWIQTRYLFVQCSSNLTFEDSKIKVTDYHPQDPTMSPKGTQGHKIVIPKTAMRQSQQAKKEKAPAKKKHKRSGTVKEPILIDVESDTGSIDTDVEDLNIFIEGEEDFIAAPFGGTHDASSKSTSSSNTLSKGKAKVSGLFSGLKSLGSKSASKAPAATSKPMTDYIPQSLDYSTLPLLAEPSWATPGATKRLQKEFHSLLKAQESQPLHELGWYTDPEQFNNVYQWIIEMHSFEATLPLAKQMKDAGIKSVVIEMRFGPDYPMSPPFLRVIKPRFLNFLAGGGGHVTAGGSICMELLTNTGWNAVSTMESVLLQVRLAVSSTDPRPAQLARHSAGEYGIGEAVEAYIRACHVHGWKIPPKFREMAMGGQQLPGVGGYR